MFARRDELNALYDDVQEDFSSYYRVVNGVELRYRRAGSKPGVNFGIRGQIGDLGQAENYPALVNCFRYICRA